MGAGDDLPQPARKNCPPQLRCLLPQGQPEPPGKADHPRERILETNRLMADGSSQPTVAIVGAGLAGLAAACALSDSGFRVILFERRPYLGGRASSYEHPGTGEIVDNCQHVLFRVCTNLVEFYRRIGVEDKIRWCDRMTFIEPGGRQSVLEPTFLPAPLQLTPSFLRFKFLTARDKLSLARGLMSLIIHQPKDD